MRIGQGTYETVSDNSDLSRPLKHAAVSALLIIIIPSVLVLAEYALIGRMFGLVITLPAWLLIWPSPFRVVVEKLVTAWGGFGKLVNDSERQHIQHGWLWRGVEKLLTAWTGFPNATVSVTRVATFTRRMIAFTLAALGLVLQVAAWRGVWLLQWQHVAGRVWIVTHTASWSVSQTWWLVRWLAIPLLPPALLLPWTWVLLRFADEVQWPMLRNSARLSPLQLKRTRRFWWPSARTEKQMPVVLPLGTPIQQDEGNVIEA